MSVHAGRMSTVSGCLGLLGSCRQREREKRSPEELRKKERKEWGRTKGNGRKRWKHRKQEERSRGEREREERDNQPTWMIITFVFLRVLFFLPRLLLHVLLRKIFDPVGIVNLFALCKRQASSGHTRASSRSTPSSDICMHIQTTNR